LKHVGFWFQCNEIEKEKYKDGFIIFFFLKTRGIEKNAAYINYDKRKEQLDMYEINDLKHNITYFIKFFKKNVNVLDIDTYTKKLIVTVYNFPEKKPKILFNLRYLKN
jgi:hypothetical protein